MEINRKNKLLLGLAAAAVILLARLFYIQIINDEYKKDASNNSMVYATIYPPRGVVYDATGRFWWATPYATTYSSPRGT